MSRCRVRAPDNIYILKAYLCNLALPDVPRLPIDDMIEDPDVDDALIPPDIRRPQRLLDALRQRDDEFSDSDDEGEGGRRNHASHRERDSVGPSSGRRFGAAVGIMSTGTTHGVGPSVAPPVTVPVVSAAPAATPTPALATAPSFVSSGPSDMDVDDPEVPTVPAVESSATPTTTAAATATAAAAVQEVQDHPMAEQPEPVSAPTVEPPTTTPIVPEPVPNASVVNGSADLDTPAPPVSSARQVTPPASENEVPPPAPPPATNSAPGS